MRKKITKGEFPLAFDVLLGDALFVDRFSYNFFKPSLGDPIVFRTGSIDRFNQQVNLSTFSSIGEDKYYIKRLVGQPGDTLEMRVPEEIFTNGTDLSKGVPGVLYRNNSPIDGKKHLLKIAYIPNRLPLTQNINPSLDILVTKQKVCFRTKTPSMFLIKMIL